MSSVPSINAVCTLAFRAARPRTSHRLAINSKRAALTRGYADATNDPSKLPTAPANDPVGPNMAQAEHVSEEAAKMAKITGGEGPDIEGQGTPVQEILKNEPETKANAPKVLKNEPTPSTKRSFSTYARRQAGLESGESTPGGLDPSMIPTSEQRAQFASSKSPLIPKPRSPAAVQVEQEQATLRFPPPKEEFTKPRTRVASDQPLLEQLTKLLNKSGKLARAERNMAYIQNHLRSSPPPTYSKTRVLMPNAPLAENLPLDPEAYITLAIDSLAPLLRIQRMKGAAGGGRALELPVSLTQRQRRRVAFTWILAAVEKKQSRASGKYMLAHKIAEELIAIVEGRSSLWTRRDMLHKAATTARANLSSNRIKTRKMKGK